ncbi:MAG TPA: ABC transporter substrate-binding protein [Streptosporangiaceae bacterium]|nr:ABC transporter substrate-binding protein [Streptosporangiaceae bacterium]
MIRFARTGTKVAAIAAVGVTALAACSSSSSPSGVVKAGSGFAGIPAPAAKHVAGGTVTFGMAAGATPTYIFPIVPGADSSVYTISYFQQLFWRPLWWTPVGHSLNVNYPLSLAKAPVWSNGNTTVTISMDTNYKWSNGQPVDAQDVIFYIDLLKAAVKLSPANSGNYTPGYFPDNVKSAVATSKFTVQLNLTKAYNPNYYFYDQLLLITPLPSTAWNIDKAGGPAVDFTNLKNAEKIYTFLNAQSLKLSTYATNPLWQTVDGPFKLTQFNPSTDANTMAPNPAYTGPNKPTIKAFQEVAFTSDTAEYTALLDGQLTVGLVPSTDYPQIPNLKKKGYNVFGFPNFGWDYMPINFLNTTNHWNMVVAQLYVRQALAHLVDLAGYIKGVYHGYAAVADGPVPSVPISPFTPANATNPPYPFSVSAAKALLTAHGWKIVSGTQTCESPGTGAANCGAGIPKGTPLSFTLVYNNGSPAITSEDTAYASDAKQAGIPVTLVGKTFNFILSNYYNLAAPHNKNKWWIEDFGGFTQSLYPTTNSIFNTTGSYNIGSYSSAKANALINASVFGGNPNAVKTEASFLTQDVPALFEPDADHVYAWSTKLSGPQASFWELPQFSLNPELWYFTK